MSQKITGRDLMDQGWQPGPSMGLALDIAETLTRAGHTSADILTGLNRVQQTPEDYQQDALYGPLAKQLIALAAPPPPSVIRAEPVPYNVWGEDFEEITYKQMDNAAHLPIAHLGALMPDGHPGYGLPIGGVLATDNSVIPYGVGMDIACRLRLSIFPEAPAFLDAQRDRLRKALIFNTRFGIGKRDGAWHDFDRRDHPLLDDPRWRDTAILRRLQDKAVNQMGTSGGSNHFAEWAALTALEDSPELGLAAGDMRLCFVTHSGSRGVGGTIAQEYTRVAKSKHPELPKKYQELSWLSLDSEAGQEYWLAMTMAGEFASACHETIHDTVLAEAGLKVAAYVENHHNFAWQEEHQGRTLIVHRKGATPAGKDVLGIIPGTMGDKGYIVKGLGNADSLNSSSHGAGRPRSRTASKQLITRHQRDAYLRQRGVELLNPDGGVDEAPQAYKNPAEVMAQQTDLVRPIATFMPLMVLMDSDKQSSRRQNKGKHSKKRSRGKKRRR